MQLAARVANEMEQWKPHAVFVDAGGGAGVIDRLRQLDHDVIEVQFGGKATEPTQYLNRRVEMWWLMREWLVPGGAIPDDASLKQELATPVYWYDAAGRKVLEPKDKIKERMAGAGSPDIADGHALTFAFPVHKPSAVEEVRMQRREQEVGEYDPYEGIEGARPAGGGGYDPYAES